MKISKETLWGVLRLDVGDGPQGRGQLGIILSVLGPGQGGVGMERTHAKIHIGQSQGAAWFSRVFSFEWMGKE